MNIKSISDKALITAGVSGIGIICGLALAITFARSALATSAGGTALLAQQVHSAATSVSAGFVDSFTVSCGSSATLITAPSGFAQQAYYCQTPASAETGGTVLVAVGDSGIADPDIATRNSPVYSGGTVREFYASAKKEYCRADTGTVTIYCRAIVTSEP